MPLLKRIFGQGKSKASNTLVALCIGDYSRLSISIVVHEARQLEALLAIEANCDDGSPGTSSQPVQPSTKSSNLTSHQSSFRGFRHLLQHFGGVSSTPQDGADATSQQHLIQFFKQLGGYPSISFVPASEDGLPSREKVLAKLTKLFKQSTAPVVIVAYCGPSDERGNWRLSSQANSSGSAAGASGGPSTAGSPGGGGGGGGGSSSGSGTGVISFREVSMLWQRYRKHSQRLVLLLDCANSGYWVSALRMLSKAEQLELSLGVQASDSSHPAVQSSQLTYQPGIFLQFFLSNNKWRRPQQQQQQQQHAQQQNPEQQPPPPQQQQQSSSAAAGGTVGGGGRVEQWLPGMLPTYYATWMKDNLVDYGVALRFFNVQVPPQQQQLHSGPSGGLTVNVEGPESVTLVSPGPPSASDMGRAWRSNTANLGAIASTRSLARRSRMGGDDVTSPGSDLFGSRGTMSLPRTPQDGPEALDGISEKAVAPVQLLSAQVVTARAVSVPDAVRRRFSALTDFFTGGTAAGDGGSSTYGGPCSPSTPLVLSPNNPAVERVRMSTPQAAPIPSSTTFGAHRSPTLPGDDSLYKMQVADGDGSGSVLAHMRMGTQEQASASASYYGGSQYGSAVYDTNVGGSSAPGADERGGPTSHSPGRGSLSFLMPSAAAGPGQAAAAPEAVAPPPRTAWASAVHPADVADEDSGSGISNAGGHGASVAADDNGLQVQTSARSDTAAVAWAQRSSHADRCLLGDERGGPGMASFTAAAGGGPAFATELFGALHAVATDRKLRARRAPLEGDETIDTLMEDADLERRASLASLPSVMLPRDLAETGDPSVGPVTRTPPCNTAAGSVQYPSRTLGPVLLNASPRSSTHGLAAVAAAGSGGGASEGGGTSAVAAATGAHPAEVMCSGRQPSRLFLVSMGTVNNIDGAAGLGLEGEDRRTAADRLDEAEEDGEEDGDDSGPEDVLSLSIGVQSMQVGVQGQQQQDSSMHYHQSFSVHHQHQHQHLTHHHSHGQPHVRQQTISGPQQQLRRQLQGKSRSAIRSGTSGGFAHPIDSAAPDGSDNAAPGAGGKSGGGGGHEGGGRVLEAVVSKLLQQELERANDPSNSGPAVNPAAAAAAAAAESQPVSVDWLQPSHVPPPSLTSSAVNSGVNAAADRGRVRSSTAGGIASSTMLRSVLKARVSIVDTVDLDSASLAGTPMWQRRPGRFEMAGSESSSFVFGDDRERFEMLRLLREHQAGEGGGEVDEEGRLIVTELPDTAAASAPAGPGTGARVGVAVAAAPPGVLESVETERVPAQRVGAGERGIGDGCGGGAGRPAEELSPVFGSRSDAPRGAMPAEELSPVLGGRSDAPRDEMPVEELSPLLGPRNCAPRGALPAEELSPLLGGNVPGVLALGAAAVDSSATAGFSAAMLLSMDVDASIRSGGDSLGAAPEGTQGPAMLRGFSALPDASRDRDGALMASHEMAEGAKEEAEELRTKA